MLRLAARVLLVFVVATAAPVACLRVAPPPTTAFMMRERALRLLAGESPRLARRWVPLEDIAPALGLAVVAAEDQKFPRHHGFDWGSIASAVRENPGRARPRGASTISQQTAKNLFLWPAASWVRKGLEAWLTVLLETLLPKRRILEVYLNVAQFGDGVFGAAAASQRFFGVPPGRLGEREAALLAAVLPSPDRWRPDAPSPEVRERAAWIRAQMRRLGPHHLAGL